MSLKKKIAIILTIGIIITVPIISKVIVSHADNKKESEFISVIEQYDKNNLVVENGIALNLGESLDLSEYPNWELSNKEVATIDAKGMLKPIKEGTVYLSQEIENKAYIIEVYVFEGEIIQHKGDEKQNRNYYKVFLDPGHGGKDSGATGFGNLEKTLNLQIANRVKSKLESKGIQVKMSRNSDMFLSLDERAELANKYGSDIYVSIHQNSASSSSAYGIETYHHTNKQTHKPLSTQEQTNMIYQTKGKDRGVKNANFAVLRLSNMTSTLIECGFISNQTESANLANFRYQDKLATGIANGIENYLNQYVNLEKEEIIGTGLVITESLNVRSGYGVDFPIIGTLPKGSIVEICESSNKWYKIKYNDGYGYVSSNYVKLGFKDISNHWAEDAINKFVDKGYVDGYNDNTFRPNNKITRAEFIKIVNKYFELTEQATEGMIKFSDVNPSAWYYTDLCIAIKAGYINGYEDNTFRPNGLITRQEAACIVTNITKLIGDGNLEFLDSDNISLFANSAVDALSDNNIMGGYSDNTFRPRNSITRAEAVSTFSRIK